MKTFPMFLQMKGRRVVIVGGGEQAAQKTRLMLKTEARIEILAQGLEEELQALAEAGRVTHVTERVTPAHFADTALCFVASGCPGADAAMHALAKAGGATVNVVDQPELCDALTPSIVDRDPVVIAIGTEGTAPVLARQIKTQMEQALEPRLGELAALAGRLRGAAMARLAPRDRRDLWRWVFNDLPRKAFARGSEREAARAIKDAIQTGDFRADKDGSVALVGAGPGAKDLITLRGVQRLQEADVIFYDRLVDPKILELARRDAERVYVGKKPGCHAWPQSKITQMLVAAAKQGQRVVRLKCGDPGIFARGAEELSALTEVGIPVEIVPGVTAASGAAAASGQMLTQRGEIDQLILTTGHLDDGPRAPDWLEQLKPGACVALYMAVSAAPMIARNLRRSPYCALVEVEIVADAQRANQKVLRCAPDQLAETLSQNDIRNSAMIFLRLPKSTVQPARQPLRVVETA
ncbi:siroheme synthase CysG [Cognatishimia sp. MH4019]|uniref:siroheme synthase CysG n=1 Tax=Cognatishimia sp. MH4019 TaxID=2854030 RepID=UPI001CD6D664|nr:siroheme synthase CysG [Cognatishimia sp. MH4019]